MLFEQSLNLSFAKVQTGFKVRKTDQPERSINFLYPEFNLLGKCP